MHVSNHPSSLSEGQRQSEREEKQYLLCLMCISQRVGEFSSAISRVKRVFSHTLKCRRSREIFCCPKLWFGDMRRSSHNVHILYARYYARATCVINVISLECIRTHEHGTSVERYRRTSTHTEPMNIVRFSGRRQKTEIVLHPANSIQYWTTLRLDRLKN